MLTDLKTSESKTAQTKIKQTVARSVEACASQLMQEAESRPEGQPTVA